MGFGTFIREKREQARVPMNELARSLGISPAYWSHRTREKLYGCKPYPAVSIAAPFKQANDPVVA